MSDDPRQRLADLDAVFAALGHASRRQILLTVHFWGGEMSAGDIASRFGHAWPTITRHLKVLTDARLLSVERKGRTRIYRLNRARMKIVEKWLEWFESSVKTDAGALERKALRLVLR